jgi:hypothetical protein
VGRFCDFFILEIDKAFNTTILLCCLIPELIDIGGPWKVLPPGVFNASLDEIKDAYAYNEHRKCLFEGFIKGFANLQNAGCQNIFLNGGFIGGAPTPTDFDVCWLPFGVDSKKLDPVLLDFSKKREAQKKKYGGEFFISTAKAAPGFTYFSYFQKDKHTGKPKGIIHVH